MKKNWIDVFQKTVEKYKDAIAVVHNNKSATFGEIRHRALCIAAELNSRADEINRPIVVLLPKSIEVIYANIGIMYNHNIFSNLDVKMPKERLGNILNCLKPIGIITDTNGLNLVDINPDMFVINLDHMDWNYNYDINSILCKLEKQIDTDPFCIINTSGSTGTPKGVVLNHKSFFDFMDWSLDVFHFTSQDIIGSLSPVIFDIYEYELTLMMTVGAKIVLLDAGLAVFPAKLISAVAEHKVTFMFWVPTIMVNIANMDILSRIPLPSVRTIWFAGEVFPTKQFNYWKCNLPETVFANLYGPIEITLDCIYYIVDRDFNDQDTLPIGIPCKNTDILLLNDSDQICQSDEEGEICVRGTSLAMGYYNNPEKTSAAFVQNPLNNSYPELIYRTGDIGVKSSTDNLIYFKGRKDSLIKHMGYRIELSEIEHIMVNELKIVKNCCVIYNSSKKEIHVFYEKKELSTREMRDKLLSVLPKYMIPTVWTELDELPRNTNGKIDRHKLSCISNNKE
ncbi:MAG: AMP-binding protein [Lachnospiraceae bacterium]|nr:AMP-binding protein [Lachnospiraceae bacterium]